MNENKLYTLKEIAAELGVNYKTLLSCKDRFNDFVFGIPYGRVAKYSGDFVDFFKLVFALFDEGYSTLKIRTLLLNGVDEDDDSFIEPWLETWRGKLYISGVKDREHYLKQDDGMTTICGLRESIENGRPDRDVVVQWVMTQRETQPPPSYKKLAGILNEAKIPTLSGRDAWSRSTLRNLAVRAEEA